MIYFIRPKAYITMVQMVLLSQIDTLDKFTAITINQKPIFFLRLQI